MEMEGLVYNILYFALVSIVTGGYSFALVSIVTGGYSFALLFYISQEVVK